MAFPNISDILATTIERRSKKLADNVTKNNALLAKLSSKEGGIRTFSGGHKILEEISFAENGNFGWYSGYESLPVAAQDVISSAEFDIKQAAVAIVISGLEQLQNAGEEQMIDLMAGRIRVGESTMKNNICSALYSDGTAFGGKQLTGLATAVPTDPTTGTYGAINRATNTFWRSQLEDPAVTPTKDTIQTAFNNLWAKCTRGSDRPDLILLDNVLWGLWMASLQSIQRISDPSSARLGFPATKYQDADVVLDGGIGGFCPASTGFFLNTDYIHYRPHKSRNMVPLNPTRRYAVNQDAEVQILAFAGNMTVSGSQFHGRLIGT